MKVIHKILPSWIYKRLITDWDQDGLKKYFKNTGWIFFAKVITLVMSFFTMTIVAQYLGPENLGKISYAQSFTALFSIFATLGINQILLRELVAKPEQEEKLLGTAIGTKFIFGLFTFFTTMIVAYQIDTDPIITWLVGITSLTYILQPFGSVSLAFSARVQDKYPAYVTIVSTLLISALKILVIFFDKGILFFAAIIAFEALFYTVANLYLYLTVIKKTLRSWIFSYPTFVYLLSQSWPLMLAGAANTIYARIDQIMLQHLIDSAAVGFYDIAARLTDLLGFIPGMIVGSLLPAIINAKKTNPLEYKKRLQSLAILCLGISAAMASILYLLAPSIINILFGETFEESVKILRIYVWSNLGTVALMLVYQYLLVEEKVRLMLIFTIFAAILNVLLNLLLIPRLGVEGAAYATVATLLSTVILFILARKRLVKKVPYTTPS